MFNFILGCILGFFVATMGFTGIAQALDKTIDSAKNITVISTNSFANGAGWGYIILYKEI